MRTGPDLTFGERAADFAVKAMGSWSFLFSQTLCISTWMVLNVVSWCEHWDPRPWIVLNLVFSIQAAYAAPLILIAAKRTDQRNSELAIHTREQVQEILALLRDKPEET